MKGLKKVMWITRKVFYPPDDGFKKVTWGTIKTFLEKKHQVTVIIFSPEKEYKKIYELCDRYENLEIIVYTYDPKLSLKLLFRSVFSPYPFNILKHNTLNCLEKVKTVISSRKPYYIILDSLHLSNWYKPLKKVFPDTKILLREHNLEWEIAEGYFKYTNNFLYKTFLFNQYKKLQRYEISMVREIDGTIFISNKDRIRAEKFVGRKKMFVSIPCGIDIFNERYQEKRDCRKLCFIGRLDWYPNYEGLLWFLKRIFYILCDEFPDIRMEVIGKNFPLKYFEHKNIEFKGRVKSIYPYLYSAGALIVPIFFGGGIRIKVIDALSTGIPVFSTYKGVEGLGLKKNIHYIECNTDQEFLISLKEFLKKPDKYIEIGKAGQEFVKKNYSWNRIYYLWKNFLERINSYEDRF